MSTDLEESELTFPIVKARNRPQIPPPLPPRLQHISNDGSYSPEEDEDDEDFSISSCSSTSSSVASFNSLEETIYSPNALRKPSRPPAPPPPRHPPPKLVLSSSEE